MGLVKCAACAGDVADEAMACPKCGQPTPRAKRTAAAAPLANLLVGLIAMAALIGGLYYGCGWFLR